MQTGLCNPRRCIDYYIDCMRSCLLLSSGPIAWYNVPVREEGKSRNDNQGNGIAGRSEYSDRWVGAKGLSGGQKRRVSICIEILTRPKLLFLDEPTSGLDSAASFYVMSRIASLNRKDGIGRTIIASIHQPSSEVFQLFHNIYLLSAGKTVYFGPVSAANEVFAPLLQYYKFCM